MKNSTLPSEEVLALICVTVSDLLTYLNQDDITTIRFRHKFLKSYLLEFLQCGMVHEVIFEVTGTTILLLGPQLDEFGILPLLLPYLKSAATVPEVSRLVISLIGDLFRALGNESVPYLDDFCKKVFMILSKNEVDSKLQADCIATLNDMAISVGSQHFQPYLAELFRQLQHASGFTDKNVQYN